MFDHRKPASGQKHGSSRRTRSAILGIAIVVSIGGMVEIIPLFFLKSTVPPLEGVKPYTPLALEGRDIFIREGCVGCHSQMIRPFRTETERYGAFSKPAELQYDHPHLWGSKRTGPDLARLGGKYSDEWHRDHLRDPRTVVPTSIMPAYPFLDRRLDYDTIADDLKANRAVGVPYTEAMIAQAKRDLVAQANPDDPGSRRVPEALPEGRRTRFRRRPEARDRDGCARRIPADARHPRRVQALR